MYFKKIFALQRLRALQLKVKIGLIMKKIIFFIMQK